MYISDLFATVDTVTMVLVITGVLAFALVLSVLVRRKQPPDAETALNSALETEPGKPFERGMGANMPPGWIGKTAEDVATRRGMVVKRIAGHRRPRGSTGRWFKFDPALRGLPALRGRLGLHGRRGVRSQLR